MVVLHPPSKRIENLIDRGTCVSSESNYKISWWQKEKGVTALKAVTP
jgi:hypothetical protein